jgi:glycosyltransferase involved in cell wall biosynthesis
MPEPFASAARAAQGSRTPGATLSVVVITRNEEHTLSRCLERLDFATEIIVADSGSTDGTLAVARRFTSHVVSVPWRGFGPTKQAALEQATCTWVLSLDADEVVDDELAQALRTVVRANDPRVAGYRINRRSNFLGTWMKHSGWYPDWVTRVARRERVRFSEHAVHEQMLVEGPVEPLPGHLLHYTDPDWPHYLAKLTRYADLSARALHAQGRRASVWDLTVRPAYQFVRTYVLQAGVLDGRAGLVLACGSAFHVFSKYARLWDLGREHSGVHSDG